jgi:hypothetical protein
MNPEGKKVHCIADPAKVNSAQFAGMVNQMQNSSVIPPALNYPRFENPFDAASVMSSFSQIRSDHNYLSQEALHAVQAMSEGLKYENRKKD